jgi:hypothetical protein
MVSQSGWRVERVTVTRRPDGVSNDVFRVSWKGYWQADCATTGEVADHVDLSTLVPTGWAGDRAQGHRSIATPTSSQPAGLSQTPAARAARAARAGGRSPLAPLRLLPGGGEDRPRRRP